MLPCSIRGSIPELIMNSDYHVCLRHRQLSGNSSFRVVRDRGRATREHCPRYTPRQLARGRSSIFILGRPRKAHYIPLRSACRQGTSLCIYRQDRSNISDCHRRYADLSLKSQSRAGPIHTLSVKVTLVISALVIALSLPDVLIVAISVYVER